MYCINSFSSIMLRALVAYVNAENVDLALVLSPHFPRLRVVSAATATIRYDTRCYFNVRSKADISQLNLPHGTDN